MKRMLLAVPVILLGLAAGGCANRYSYGYVRVAPPPPRAEVYGYAPSPGYVWVNGYWGYGGGRYSWVSGSWVRPPRPRARWVPGRWDSTPRGYYWRQGHWR